MPRQTFGVYKLAHHDDITGGQEATKNGKDKRASGCFASMMAEDCDHPEEDDQSEDAQLEYLELVPLDDGTDIPNREKVSQSCTVC